VVWEDISMPNFKARDNINGTDLGSRKDRSTIIKLLIAEEDKLAHGLERLLLAETRTREVPRIHKRFRNSRESLVDCSKADRLLETAVEIHR
jgi:hypothetical protein